MKSSAITSIIVLASLTIMPFIFCKKDNNHDSISSKIKGKWTFVGVIEWYTWYSTSETTKDTFDLSGRGLYRDFRNDGKIYSLLPGSNGPFNDTINYEIHGNMIIEWKVPLYRDTGIIVGFSSTSFSIYQKKYPAPTSPPGFYDIWFNYIK